MNKLNIVVCAYCGEILRSVSRPNFKQCGCPNRTFIDDRAPEYRRMGGVDISAVKACLTVAEANRLSAAFKIKPTAPKPQPILEVEATPKTTVTKKKRKSQPPPFITLMREWENSGHGKHLRFGQWFIGQYLPLYHGEDIDYIWTTTNVSSAAKFIFKFYQQYQWEII